MDDSEIYNGCAEFKDWKSFSEMLCQHDEFIINWKKQFDLSNNQRNLLGGNIELMDNWKCIEQSEIKQYNDISYQFKTYSRIS